MDATVDPTPETPANRRTLAAGLGLVAFVAFLKLALHLFSTGRFGYGFFVDELYYLACGEHLAWGFVDMPPLFPAITALIRAVLGDSLFAIRLLPTLSGAALVLMTGLMARDLGGRRFAQGIAALGVLTAPIWLALHSLYTMNALEQLLWLAGAWIVVRIDRDGWDKGWLLFGALAGIGMLNKHSMAFFGAAVVVGIVLTPARRALRSPWLWLGGVLAVLIYLPNLIWDVQHHFPHFEMLANIKANGRDVQLNPFAFMVQQAMFLNPIALPLWLGGLVWFLVDREGRRYRILGIMYVAVIVEMFLLDGRVYYPAPAYPMLLAGGGVALERWLARWRFVRPAYAGLLALSGAVLAPLFVPVLPPETLIRYQKALGMAPPAIENHKLGPLPQLMADRFGWPEMAAEVARIYRSLPARDRAKTTILGQNYGQAGAIDLFGPALGLPKAISGHLTYFYWGPRQYTGDVVIVLDEDRETLEKRFRSVEYGGRVEHRYSMPYQHFDVWVCRGMHRPLAEVWPDLKAWD